MEKDSEYQFIPKLRGKRVTIRLLPNHQPVSGILVAFNPYEVVLDVARGGKVSGKNVIYFKHVIVSIEPEETIKL